MRRGRILTIFNVIFLVAGLGCLAYGMRFSEFLSESRENAFIGGVLVVLAGISGLFAGTLFRRHSRMLAESVRKATEKGQISYLEAADSELLPLVAGVNDLLAIAENSIQDASFKSKELEIELKVANAQRQHAEAILYSINDAVIVTDPFDEVVLANDSASRTFGFDPASALRTPVDRVIKDPAIVELIQEMRQSESAASRRTVEHTVSTPQGDRVFKLTLSCVSDSPEGATNRSFDDVAAEASQSKANRAPAGVVAVLHDVTREKEIAQMKNEFVSNVSHELRTPLASIKAYIEMLIDGETDSEKTQREFYEVIQNESNRLGRLIDNILNISRIESGLVKIDRHPQSLMVIIKEALEVISPQAKAKEIKLVDRLSPAIYQTLADKDMLYQAVLNLLSNSVKYTPQGGTITVQTEVDEAGRRVTTRIIDTGVGIPPKDLPFVFDKFYRVSANNRMAKGTGLGLSLVKQIIENVHRGRMFVESQVGQGSTFGFELEVCE